MNINKGIKTTVFRKNERNEKRILSACHIFFRLATCISSSRVLHILMFSLIKTGPFSDISVYFNL